MDSTKVCSSIVDLQYNLQKRLNTCDSLCNVDIEVQELPILIALYQDINYMTASSPYILPYVIGEALQQCSLAQKYFFQILDDMEYIKLKHSRLLINRLRYRIKYYYKVDQLFKAQGALKDAIMLLRTLIMDSASRQHLEGIQHAISGRAQAGHQKETDSMDTFAPSFESSKPGNIGASIQTLDCGPGIDDPSLFNATVAIANSDNNVRFIPARGKFDTGADVNLVSRRFIDRAGINAQVEALDQAKDFQGIAGARFSSSSRVTLDWFLSNAACSNNTNFYIVEDDSFDILLGMGFVNENNLLRQIPAVYMFKLRRLGSMVKTQDMLKAVEERIALANQDKAKQDAALKQKARNYIIAQRMKFNRPSLNIAAQTPAKGEK